MNWNGRFDDNARVNNNNASGSVPFGFSRNFSSPEVRTEQEESFQKDQNRIAGLLDLVVKFSLFAIFFGLPLFFTNLTYQGISFEKQIYFYFWILLALVAWGAKSGYLGEMKIKKTSLDIPILAFWFFYLIATVFSIDRWHSFVGFFGNPSRGFISITAMIVLYYLIASNFSENLFRWLIRGIMASGMVALIIGVFKIFEINLFSSVLGVFPESVTGSFKNLAVFAGFLIPIFAMAILKIQEDQSVSSYKKNIYTFSLMFFIALALVTVSALYNYLPVYKSFPLAGLVIGSAFFLIFVLAKIVRPREAWTLLPMVVFILVLALLMVGPMKEKLVSVSVPYKTSIEIAQGSLKDNFFIGSGPGTYGYAFSKYLPKGFDNTIGSVNLRFFEGEGMLLETVSAIGAIGTALFLIIILTFLGTSVFLLYREKEKNKIYSLGMVSAVLVLLTNVLISRTEGFNLILLAMAISLAVGIIFSESNVKERFINFSLKTSPKFALTLGFISLLIFASVAFLFVFFGKIYLADIYMGASVKANKISEEGSISKIIKAINLNNREGRYYSFLGQQYMSLANEEILKGESERDIDKIRVYISNGTNAGKKGEELMKNDVTATEALAQIYENSGLYLAEGLDYAEKEYQRALELEPANPSFYVRLGQIKTKMAAAKTKPEEKKKLVEEARDLFQKSLDTRGNFDPAYYNLALAQEALGQIDDAIDNMTKAAGLQRNNINYVFNLARLLQSRGKENDNKVAEALFKQILGVNDKEINTHFNLGLLYEKTDRKQEAIAEYEKVLDLLPKESDKTKAQLEKMIDNLRRGIENTPENLGLTNNQASEENPQENNPEQTEQVPVQ